MMKRLLILYFIVTIIVTVVGLYLWNSPSLLYNVSRNYANNPAVGPAAAARLEQLLAAGCLTKEGFRIAVVKNLNELKHRDIEDFGELLLKRTKDSGISREELAVAAGYAMRFKNLDQAKTLLDRAQAMKKAPTDIIDTPEGHDSYIDDLRKQWRLPAFAPPTPTSR